MKTTPYTTAHRETTTDLTDIEVTFVENGQEIVVTGSDMDEFHQNWTAALMPSRIKGSKVGGVKAAIYPTVLAFTPMAVGYLTSGALAIVNKGEGRTYQTPQQAVDAVRALNAMHSKLGSPKDKKAYADPLKAFVWTGKILS